MKFPFNARSGLIIVEADLFGPLGTIALRLALDTGATTTMINGAPLIGVGYDPALAPSRIQVTTGSGVEYVPRLKIDRIKALGKDLMQFWLLSHTLPTSATIDGLLGLDFLRGQTLVVDFRFGTISLS